MLITQLSNSCSSFFFLLPVAFSLYVLSELFCFKDIPTPTDINATQDFLNRYKGFSLHLYTNVKGNSSSIYRGRVIKLTLKTRFKIALDNFKNGYPIYKNI